MRAFLIVILLFLVFILFSSSSMSNIDLTPNTPPVTNGVMAQAPVRDIPSPPDVIVVNGAVPAAQIAAAPLADGVVPVTGGVCSNPYTVRSGDMLSGIAELCNTTVASIRLANPQITNINLIYPGQQLAVPGALAAVNQPAVIQPVVPVTGVEAQVIIPQNKNDTQSQLWTAPQVQTAPEVQAAPEPQAVPVMPVSGPDPVLLAGTRLHVTANNYPPNTLVNVAIGPQTVGYNIVATASTDATGSLTTTITVPNAPDPNTLWVVVVATSGQPSIQAMSRPFTIWNP